MNNTISSHLAPEPVGAYPHAKLVGDLLFLSGVGPRQRGSKDIPGVSLDENGKVTSHDIALQCHSVFKNVETILIDSGAKLTDLVDVTVFLTNMQDDFKIYNQEWKNFFGENPPCRTTVEILSLPTPIAIELKCIAYMGNKS